jgi:integrase
MGSHLKKYLMPRFGSLPMAAIDERRVQEFITDLSRMEYKWPNGVKRRLSPKTTRNIVEVLQLIVGEKVWRDWELRYPENPDKEQRWFNPDEMRRIVNAATGQWKVLFAALAGTGMRCGEAFGLHVDDLDLKAGKIYIRRSVRDGQEGSVKTKRGYRKVDIDPVLVETLTKHLNGRTSGRVFQTNRGTPHSRNNVRRKLNQILKALNLPSAGLHAFRHGRVSVCRVNGVPDDLVTEWVGHSNLKTTSIYTHFQDDFRQRIASEVALFSPGFAEGSLAEKLPDGPNGPNFPSFAPFARAA